MKAKEFLDVINTLYEEKKIAEQLLDYYSTWIIHLNNEIEKFIEQNLRNSVQVKLG